MSKKILIFDCERESVDFNKMKKKINLKRIFKEEEVVSNFKNFRMGYDFYISRDHSTSYDLLKKLNKRVALIIFDQHIDLWDYKIVGNKLNKANFLRKCFEDGYLDFIVFIGTRKGERSIYYNNFLFNKTDRDFIRKLQKERALSGFENKIKLIGGKNFSKSLLKAYDYLKKKGFNDICLDIDLDVFDSNIIKGVEYNKENLDNVPEEKTRDYLFNELSRSGVSSRINFKKIKEKNIDLVYKHITEFRPELDANGKTLGLIKELINGL